METLATEHELSLQLNAGTIDSAAGIIRGATVAQAGVVALGKVVMLDGEDNVTRDPNKAKKRLGVVTDEATLDTLMAAAQDAGGILKIRSDHSDALDKRAGVARNFQKLAAEVVDGKQLPARVVADLHLNKSYRDRDVVIETAQNTPTLIGLSIDFLPRWEMAGDRALMRVEELFAVDIVDAGAITHGGLFLNRSVDKTPKVKIKPESSTTMAAENSPTIEQCMTAITELTKTIAAMKAAADEQAPKQAEALTSGLKTISDKMDAQNETILQLKKEQTALGTKLATAPVQDAAAVEAERVRLAKEKEEKDKAALNGKTYLQLVDDAVTAAGGPAKLKRSDAHRQVMSAHPDKYAAHQKNLGVYDASRDPARQTA